MFSLYEGESVPFETLKDKVFTKVKKTDEEIKFFINDRHYFSMLHPQSCCESVYIEDVAGDLEDLIGNPILHAEESTREDNPEDEYGIGMWTFYKLATVKGWVDIRWYGSSNGYYGVAVHLYEFNADKILERRQKGHI